ncbi:Uncharacterised protein [Bordetella pertussis]|nr:Uncharacterised protein [Bordetella pertussis]
MFAPPPSRAGLGHGPGVLSLRPVRTGAPPAGRPLQATCAYLISESTANTACER